jgi:predicted DNA-binding antitoxin AbrB/MazE fold protein
MSQPIRAVYSHGRLRLLDDVQLNEGQEVHLVILSEKERARIALGGLIMVPRGRSVEEIDEAALLEEIAKGYRGTPLLSDAIIADRREGP